MITVAVYLHQRAYGGPEEGGWWYDAYTPALNDEFAHLIRHFSSAEEHERAAQDYTDHLQNVLDDEYNASLPPVHSVNSDGVYEALITENYELTDIPSRRPHYE